MDNRQFERVDFQAEALIKHSDLSFRGQVENLSLKGMFVRTDQRLNVNETVGITLYFRGTSADMSFSLKGKVVRITDDGIGVNFNKIDLDTLVHAEKGMTGKGHSGKRGLDDYYHFFEYDLDEENMPSA